ncbi:hypothetical protein BD413DRAFT_95941 [Trametes elegans]|nr:hypothetical protein BD413DRAFT_95941 [Trametes elegans]
MADWLDGVDVPSLFSQPLGPPACRLRSIWDPATSVQYEKSAIRYRAPSPWSHSGRESSACSVIRHGRAEARTGMMLEPIRLVGDGALQAAAFLATRAQDCHGSGGVEGFVDQGRFYGARARGAMGLGVYASVCRVWWTRWMLACAAWYWTTFYIYVPAFSIH